MGRSTWPLSQPVKRRSRSITSCPGQRFRGIELSREEQLRTLSVPLVDGVSSTLATVLNVSNLGEAGAGDTEELRVGRVSDGICVGGGEGRRYRTARQMPYGNRASNGTPMTVCCCVIWPVQHPRRRYLDCGLMTSYGLAAMKPMIKRRDGKCGVELRLLHMLGRSGAQQEAWP